MRKLYLIFLCFLFIPISSYAWIGSNAYCRLCFPQSYYYLPELTWVERTIPKDWQVFYVPGAIYGIVCNPDQGIDKYEIWFRDLETDEEQLIVEVDGHNENKITFLTDGSLVKEKVNVQVGKKYEAKLIAWDLNGDTWQDTAIVQIQRR